MKKIISLIVAFVVSMAIGFGASNAVKDWIDMKRRIEVLECTAAVQQNTMELMFALLQIYGGRSVGEEESGEENKVNI